MIGGLNVNFVDRVSVRCQMLCELPSISFFYLLDIFHFDKSINPHVWLQHLPAKSSFKVKSFFPAIEA